MAKSRKPGRPLSFDRQKALRQAMLAFWEHGYETTSIADLTQAMGITAPSLYTAFGDKKQLFLEAARLYAGSPDTLQQKLDQAETALDAAREMLRTAAISFTEESGPRGCLLASATASGSVDSGTVQHQIAEIRRDILLRLTRRIERDIASGLVPASTSAAALAGMVVAVVQGMSVLARDGLSRDALMAVADSATKGWPLPSKDSARV